MSKQQVQESDSSNERVTDTSSGQGRQEYSGAWGKLVREYLSEEGCSHGLLPCGNIAQCYVCQLSNKAGNSEFYGKSDF